MPVGLAVGDISNFRKYVKNIGRAYQKRSVAMIQLCRLFLEISSGKPEQTDALKGLTTRLFRRSFYLLISPSLVSLKLSRMPSSPQSRLGKDVVRLPMKRSSRQRSG
jgi:hypothetical protein